MSDPEPLTREELMRLAADRNNSGRPHGYVDITNDGLARLLATLVSQAEAIDVLQSEVLELRERAGLVAPPVVVACAVEGCDELATHRGAANGKPYCDGHSPKHPALRAPLQAPSAIDSTQYEPAARGCSLCLMQVHTLAGEPRTARRRCERCDRAQETPPVPPSEAVGSGSVE